MTLDGPREMADLRAAFKWLTARTDVSDTQIGAMGISLGGGAVLRAAVEGVPFKAIVPATTWTDLYRALFPQGWPKTGAIANFLQSVRTWDPDRLRVAQDAIRSAEHPHRPGFRRTAVVSPGAHRPDDADILHPGPPRLRLRHRAGEGRLQGGERAEAALPRQPRPRARPPIPPAEKPHYRTEVREWFDRYLKGLPNGIDTRPPIEVAADPWTGKTASFKTLPEDEGADLAAEGDANDRRGREDRQDGEASEASARSVRLRHP